MKSTALLLAALAAVAAVTAAIRPAAEVRPPAPAVSPAPVVPMPSVPPVPVPAAGRAAPAAAATAPSVTYPDGSTMPLLNGVREPIAVQWPANRPFSPIVGSVTDEHGIGWYRHRDGTWSTVRMLHDSARGVDVATSQVFSPMPVKQRSRLQAPGGG